MPVELTRLWVDASEASRHCGLIPVKLHDVVGLMPTKLHDVVNLMPMKLYDVVDLMQRSFTTLWV